jgi:hypothetical protein
MPGNLTDYSFQNTVMASANVPPKRQPTSIFNRDQMQIGLSILTNDTFSSQLAFELQMVIA